MAKVFDGDALSTTGLMTLLAGPVLIELKKLSKLLNAFTVAGDFSMGLLAVDGFTDELLTVEVFIVVSISVVSTVVIG